MNTVYFMNTEDNLKRVKESAGLIKNTESLIMSKGLEDIISNNFDEQTGKSFTASIDDASYPIELIEMQRSSQGMEVSFSENITM